MVAKAAVVETVSRSTMALLPGQGSDSIRKAVEPAAVSEAKLSV
jgi:hypothetical protein